MVNKYTALFTFDLSNWLKVDKKKGNSCELMTTSISQSPTMLPNTAL